MSTTAVRQYKGVHEWRYGNRVCTLRASPAMRSSGKCFFNGWKAGASVGGLGHKVNRVARVPASVTRGCPMEKKKWLLLQVVPAPVGAADVRPDLIEHQHTTTTTGPGRLD